jgi:hypothetical protein
VPTEVAIPVGETANTVSDLMRGLSSAEIEAGDVSRLITARFGEDGSWQGAQTAQEMHGLYSKLREDARMASAGPTPRANRARISNAVADAILRDFDEVPEAADPLTEARIYTRTMAEAFEQGTIGNVMATQRTGGDRVDPVLTLQTTVGRGGDAGAVAADDIGRAVTMPGRDATTTGNAVQDFLRGEFAAATGRRGGFSTTAAENFLRSNRELMEQFPELRASLEGGLDAQRRAEATSSRVGGTLRALDDPRQSAGAAALRRDTLAEGILASADPARTAREVRRQAAKDETGDALRGLKGSVLDHVIRSSQTGTANAAGQRLISGNNMVALFDDPASWGLMSGVLDTGEISRLRVIAREFQKLEMSRGAGREAEVIDDAPAQFIAYPMRMLAARIGAQAGGGGGGSIQTAGMASNRVTRLLESLTNDRAEMLLRDAVQDGSLMRELLTPLDTPQSIERVANRLTRWATGTAGVALSEDEEAAP